MNSAAGSLFLLSVVAISLSFLAVDLAREPLTLKRYLLGGPEDQNTIEVPVPSLSFFDDSPKTPRTKSQEGFTETSTGNFYPKDFRGPSAPPSIIGPKSNPPDD